MSTHNIIFKRRWSYVDQMKEGWHTSGVATAIKVMPETFLLLFTSLDEIITPGTLISIAHNP